jgi:hypothetical protein
MTKKSPGSSSDNKLEAALGMTQQTPNPANGAPILDSVNDPLLIAESSPVPGPIVATLRPGQTEALSTRARDTELKSVVSLEESAPALEVANHTIAAAALNEDVTVDGSADEASAASDQVTRSTLPDWDRHEDGRWFIGDGGAAADIVAAPASPHGRPDTVIDGATVGGISYRAVSTRGVSHRDQARPRQDAYGFRFSSCGSWLVGCVADGVSEGRHSHIAADLACDRTTKTVVGSLDGVVVPPTRAGWVEFARELPWQTAVDVAADAIVQEATAFVRATFERQGDADRAAELNDTLLPVSSASKVMSTTAVVFAVATRPNDDGAFPYVLTVAAGDSSGLVLSGETWSPVTPVKNAGEEIASSSVRPLPRRGPLSPVVGVLEPGDVLVVITDGVGDPLGSGTGIVGRFLAQAWRVAPDLVEFASQVSFVRRTFVDDRTAFVVWGPDR